MWKGRKVPLKTSRNTSNQLSYTDRSIKRSILLYTINIITCLQPDRKILTQCFSCLSIANREKIISKIFSVKNSLNQITENNNSLLEDALEDLDDPGVLASTVVNAVLKKRITYRFNDIKNELLFHLNKELSLINAGESSFDRRLKDLAAMFSLSDADLAILKLIYLSFSCNNESLNNIFDDRNYDEFVKVASIATELTNTEIKKSLNKSGILVSSGIIETIDATGRSFVSLDSSIDEYLAGLSEKSVAEKFVRPDSGKRLKTESFSLSKEDISLIKDILISGAPCNILLYGIPGTGKTEFARSIAALCSKNVYLLRYGEAEIGSRNRSSDSDSRKLTLRIAINTVTENGGILIADEADFLLNTVSPFFDSSRPEKGWLNDLLDNSRARIIWITNKTGSMEESTLRRFNYSLCFKKFGREERIAIWNNILKRNPLKKYITPELINELSERYEVNAGGISSSVNTLRQISLVKELGTDEVKPLLEKLLSRHVVLTGGAEKKKKKLVDLTDKYDLTFLNTDIDISKLVQSLKRFTQFKSDENNKLNMNILLWGESGTGKTEFAKYLASSSRKGLIIKRASDLMNMYVGETEKLIREAFREAEEKKSILFIDEADTFFGSRDRARASWEVSFTNEFLVQMENFNGILICCTNLLDIFDTAAMRRFNWKVKFNPLLPEKRVPLYERYFMDNASSLSQKQKNRITGIENLTPGHAKAVHHRLFFIPDNSIDHDLIINELEKEASFMKLQAPKKTGFAV